MKYLSLFSGIGGFELGIQYALSTTKGQQQRRNTDNMPMYGESLMGAQCVGYSEIDKYAIQTYQSHFPEHHNYGDITKINERELPDFDFLVGGFPCQSFSIAGKRGGFEDTRGTLFFDIARLLKQKQPRLLLLENVKGLLSHDEGRTFATIISTLDELGYDLQWQVLNSKNHGVPQNRERVFIIGHLRGTSRPKVFPFGQGERTDSTARIVTALDANYYKGIGVRGNKTRAIASERTWDCANCKDPGCPDNWTIRRLTPTECERLQGFPDNWTAGVSDTQRYKCCGNAVTVNVIRDIIYQLYHDQ